MFKAAFRSSETAFAFSVGTVCWALCLGRAYLVCVVHPVRYAIAPSCVTELKYTVLPTGGAHAAAAIGNLTGPTEGLRWPQFDGGQHFDA